MRRGVWLRITLMVTLLVVIVVFGREISDRVATSFTTLTRVPVDAGTSGMATYDASIAVLDAKQLDVLIERLAIAPAPVRAETARTLAAYPSVRAVDALLGRARLEADSEVFRVVLEALRRVAANDKALTPRIGIALADLLDTPLPHDRLRTILGTLTVLAGRELGPRATAWKAHWEAERTKASRGAGP